MTDFPAVAGRRLLRGGFAVLVGVASIGATASAAPPPVVRGAHDFAEPSPISGTCGVDGPAVKDTEVEPSVAVNPTDPRNVVVAWQQDRFQDGAALGIGVAVTRDAGSTWTVRTVPGLSKCTGESRYDRVSDPWLSFGPGGALYLATLPANVTDTGNSTAVAISRSLDGGLSWGKPTFVVEQDGTYNDKESVTADPFRPGNVYAIYSKRFTAASITYFAESHDGGATWSPPRPTYESPGTEAAGHIILVPRDGTLVDVFALATGGGEASAAIVATTSTDGGQTWSQPTPISRRESNSGTDPEKGNLVRAPAIPTAAVGPDGRIFVAWQQVTTPDAGGVLLAESRDAGKTWTDPRTVVSEPNQVIVPTLAATADGTLGLSFYDFRDDKSGDDPLTTEFWFRRSSDGGRTWSEARVAAPFDLRTAVDASGYMVGDYVGIAALPDGFANAFSMSRPAAQTGPNDVFYAAATVGGSSAAAAQAIVLPPASSTPGASCRSRRHFRIRLRRPRRDRVVRARVYVNGRLVGVVRGRRLRAPVDLRGLPRGRYLVRVVVTTRRGRVLVRERRYRTCTAKRRP